MTYGQLYLLVAAIFQCLVAAMLLSRGGRIERRLLALIVTLSSFETIVALLKVSGQDFVHQYIVDAMDHFIVASVALVLLLTPNDGAAWRKKVVVPTLVVVAVATAIDTPLRAHLIDCSGCLPPYGDPLYALFFIAHFLDQQMWFAAAMIVAFFHSAPALSRTAPGPLAVRSALIIAALSMGPMLQAGIGTVGRLPNQHGPHQSEDAILYSAINANAYVLAAVAGVLVIAYLLFQGIRQRRVGLVLLALAPLAGLAIGIWNQIHRHSANTEFVTQSLRPALIAWAMLRNDVFLLPDRFRRPLIAVVLATTSVLVFLIATILTARSDLAVSSTDASWTSASAALAIFGMLAVMSPLAFGSRTSVALDAYRIAMEEGQDGESLLRKRQELGITADQHHALTAVLRTHQVVPSRSIVGLSPGDKVGDYSVTSRLGSGGVGAAWLGEGPSGKVVLKEVVRPWEDGSDARRELLEREARITQEIRSHNVAAVHGLVDVDGNTYLVREYIEGVTLTELIGSQGVLGIDQVRRLSLDVARGLAAIHEQGRVLMDLKPDNLVLGKDGTTRIIDMGASMAADPESKMTRAFDSSTIGTLAWMAPEQIRSQPVGPFTDLWALGGIIHFALSGEHHVPLNQPAYAVQEAIVKGRPAPFPNGDAGLLDELRVWCLQRSPADRPMGSHEVVEMLEAAGA